MLTQVNQTSNSGTLSPARVVVGDSIRRPRGGRSSTSRAAIVASSDGLQSRPGILSNIETSAFSAVTLGIAERRAASSHGSTFACANAERTVSCVPLGASLIIARRKSLHSVHDEPPFEYSFRNETVLLGRAVRIHLGWAKARCDTHPSSAVMI
jgi:hypothetical protein